MNSRRSAKLTRIHRLFPKGNIWKVRIYVFASRAGTWTQGDPLSPTSLPLWSSTAATLRLPKDKWLFRGSVAFSAVTDCSSFAATNTTPRASTGSFPAAVVTAAPSRPDEPRPFGLPTAISSAVIDRSPIALPHWSGCQPRTTRFLGGPRPPLDCGICLICSGVVVSRPSLWSSTSAPSRRQPQSPEHCGEVALLCGSRPQLHRGSSVGSARFVSMVHLRGRPTQLHCGTVVWWHWVQGPVSPVRSATEAPLQGLVDPNVDRWDVFTAATDRSSIAARPAPPRTSHEPAFLCGHRLQHHCGPTKKMAEDWGGELSLRSSTAASSRSDAAHRHYTCDCLPSLRSWSVAPLRDAEQAGRCHDRRHSSLRSSTAASLVGDPARTGVLSHGPPLRSPTTASLRGRGLAGVHPVGIPPLWSSAAASSRHRGRRELWVRDRPSSAVVDRSCIAACTAPRRTGLLLSHVCGRRP